MLLAAVLPVFCANASEKKKDKRGDSKKELREERRKEQSRKDSISHVMAMRAIESDSWVFSATSITATGGPNIVVQPNVNFIKVDGKEMTFQTSTGFGGGPNNLGGITVRATVHGKTVEKDKHGDTICSFRFSGTAINGKISITIPHNAVSSYAYINFDNGRSLTMDGQVVHMSKAKMSVGSYVN